MNPEIVERDEFIVVGIRTVLDIDATDTGNLWRDEFLPRRHELKKADNRYYGVFNIILPPNESKDSRFEYVAGVIGSLESIPNGMVGWLIPAGTYAQVEAVGVAGINKTCRDLIADWLPDSGYSLTQSAMYAYTEDEHPDSPTAVWKVNVPVETPEVLEELKKWLA